MWLTQPGPSRNRPCTRSTVRWSPASTATRRSGPYALDAERTNAQWAVRPARVCSGTPEMPAQWSSSTSSRSSDRPRQQLTQRLGAIRRKRGARGVLRAVREHQRTHPAAQRPGQVVGQRPVVVDPHRFGRKPQRGKEIEQVGPARILDGDAIAGAQMRGERALDAVQRAAGHGQVIGGDRRRRTARDGRTPPAPARPPARRRAPAGSRPRRPATRRAMGSRAGFGLPVDRSRTPAGTSRPSSERGVVAGRCRTRVPRRPAVSTAPR